MEPRRSLSTASVTAGRGITKIWSPRSRRPSRPRSSDHIRDPLQGPCMTLPKPVAAYFAAEKNNDADAVALCFVADGVVRDEGQTVRGLPAIKEWNAEAKKKYHHTVEPLDSVLREGKIVVKARVSGNFPNST